MYVHAVHLLLDWCSFIRSYTCYEAILARLKGKLAVGVELVLYALCIASSYQCAIVMYFIARHACSKYSATASNSRIP